MKKVIFYQLLVLVGIAYFWLGLELSELPVWVVAYSQPISCILVATLGGTLYCLRAIYKNRCVENRWDTYWETWYYLRPITSAISGFAAYLFLKAGLVVLDASQVENGNGFGFLAFSFVAGLNVDKFVEKLEDIAKSVFGIEKSRSANSSGK